MLWPALLIVRACLLKLQVDCTIVSSSHCLAERLCGPLRNLHYPFSGGAVLTLSLLSCGKAFQLGNSFAAMAAAMSDTPGHILVLRSSCQTTWPGDKHCRPGNQSYSLGLQNLGHSHTILASGVGSSGRPVACPAWPFLGRALPRDLVPAEPRAQVQVWRRGAALTQDLQLCAAGQGQGQTPAMGMETLCNNSLSAGYWLGERSKRVLLSRTCHVLYTALYCLLCSVAMLRGTDADFLACAHTHQCLQLLQ